MVGQLLEIRVDLKATRKLTCARQRHQLHQIWTPQSPSQKVFKIADQFFSCKSDAKSKQSASHSGFFILLVLCWLFLWIRFLGSFLFFLVLFGSFCFFFNFVSYFFVLRIFLLFTVGCLGSEGDKTVIPGPKYWNPISSSKCIVLARQD